jgi:integrase
MAGLREITGMKNTPRKKTPSDLSHLWCLLIEDFKRNGRDAGGMKHVQRCISVIRAFIRKAKIDSPTAISPDVLERFLAHAKADGKSPKTLVNYRSALSVFFDFLISQGMMKQNPCLLVDVPEWQGRDKHALFLTDRECGIAVGLARKCNLFAEVALVMNSGLRVGELRLLKWDDIDFDKKLLRVHKERWDRSRAIPMSTTTVELLSAQFVKFPEFAYVFPGRKSGIHRLEYEDRPRSIDWYIRAIKPIQSEMAKFRKIPAKQTGRGWEIFRHTFAHRAARAGVDKYMLAKWLGCVDIHAVDCYYDQEPESYDPAIEDIATPS